MQVTYIALDCCHHVLAPEWRSPGALLSSNQSAQSLRTGANLLLTRAHTQTLLNWPRPNFPDLHNMVKNNTIPTRHTKSGSSVWRIICTSMGSYSWTSWSHCWQTRLNMTVRIRDVSHSLMWILSPLSGWRRASNCKLSSLPLQFVPQSHSFQGFHLCRWRPSCTPCSRHHFWR